MQFSETWYPPIRITNLFVRYSFPKINSLEGVRSELFFLAIKRALKDLDTVVILKNGRNDAIG